MTSKSVIAAISHRRAGPLDVTSRRPVAAGVAERPGHDAFSALEASCSSPHRLYRQDGFELILPM